MVAIITGDIINSRKFSAQQWLPLLKDILRQYGTSPTEWELYRGDSFQMKTAPETALFAALHIKAGLKQLRLLDARLAIGIGAQDYQASKISESNGEAYIRSGEGFQQLKKNTLILNTGNLDIDKTLNLCFSLASLTINTWSPVVATAIKTTLEHPEKNQSDLAALVNKSQSSLSEALTRGGFDEMLRLEAYYREQIEKL